jgi:glycosyltransferase involved in cell wall biosynthesis
MPSPSKLPRRKPSTGLAGFVLPSGGGGGGGGGSLLGGGGIVGGNLPHWPASTNRRSRFTASAFIILVLHVLVTWKSWSHDDDSLEYASGPLRVGSPGWLSKRTGAKRWNSSSLSSSESDSSSSTSPYELAQQFLPTFRHNHHYWPTDSLSPFSRKRVSVPFELSDDPLPVHHVHANIHFHNTPVSRHRPAANQFVRAKESLTHAQGGHAPVISIITATQNPREVMLETAKSVLGQSLQNLEWVIVDDHSTEQSSLDLLAEIAKDPRVTLLNNRGDKGLASSRNVALKYILSDDRTSKGTVPKYMASLDDDDLYEFTALEKVRLLLPPLPLVLSRNLPVHELRELTMPRVRPARRSSGCSNRTRLGTSAGSMWSNLPPRTRPSRADSTLARPTFSAYVLPRTSSTSDQSDFLFEIALADRATLYRTRLSTLRAPCWDHRVGTILSISPLVVRIGTFGFASPRCVVFFLLFSVRTRVKVPPNLHVNEQHGYWGGTVPEPLYWYRGNPASFRKQRWGNLFVDGFAPLKARIDEKHKELVKSSQFPDIPARPSRQLDVIEWEPPFDSHLARVDKSIMFIIPWLYVGGADIGALHQIQIFAEHGYRVTVVCTLYRNPAGLELRPQVLQYTHDVHVLPGFLNAADHPRYIKHLLDSRGISEVILSNSQLVYEMLPALVEQVPRVKFIDVSPYLRRRSTGTSADLSDVDPTCSICTMRPTTAGSRAVTRPTRSFRSATSREPSPALRTSATGSSTAGTPDRDRLASSSSASKCRTFRRLTRLREPRRRRTS